VEIRRAADRAVTLSPGITTRHSFSFGAHYDPANLGYGRLLAHNDDVLEPGAGYDRHPHRGIDIVTWVLSGELTHADSDGNRSVAGAGCVQVLMAGGGISHSEHNFGDVPVRFVQCWLSSGDRIQVPLYQVADAQIASHANEFVTVASSQRSVSGATVPLSLSSAGAELHAGEFSAGRACSLPAAPKSHLFVASGVVTMGAERLYAGDVARLSNSDDRTVHVESAAQLLLWTFPQPPR
jgi:redox-sensitive bicupin YhaK (pirin superfamily)